jgi:hypothetical protein
MPTQDNSVTIATDATISKLDVGPVIGRETMGVSYEDIKDDFERVQHYITNDLSILVSQDVGGNYLAAFLIACACETIAWYKYHNQLKGHLILKELLPVEWKPVAFSLYDAMRNGIGHRYETKTLKVEGKRLDICISWKEKPHLTFSPDKSAVYLNVKQMALQVHAIFGQYQNDLRNSPDLRVKFRTGSRGKWVTSPPEDEHITWIKLLSHT